MQQLVIRPWVTAGVALVGAGVIAATPVTVPLPEPLPDVHVPDIQLASDTEDITLDFVRHGQSTDNVNDILGTTPPGAPLTEEGEQQAIAVGHAIYNDGDNDIDGVYASELLRTQQTAWPLDQLLLGTGHSTDIPDGPPTILDPDQILSGLNEVNAGILEGDDLNIFTEIAYILPTVSWILGFYYVPVLGSDVDPTGMAFEDRVNDAVQTIYDNTVSDDDGKLTDAVFSHAGTISAWALMNVKNPDFSVVLDELVNERQPLSNTGQVVVTGNPEDGWTLESWDGQDVPATPDLGTALFVDFRDLITAPQMALWHVWEAVLGGDPAEISSAFETGLSEVFDAIVQFPHAVIDSFTEASGDGAGAGGAASVDLAAMFGDAV
jgi:broad specificity phosphatase PhoE